MAKYQEIQDRLREMISTIPVGGKLPSIRWLMQKYKVSQVTIDHSLSLLETSGEVVRRPCVGYYRPASQERPMRRIMFCFCYHPQRISNPLYGAMLAEFLHRSETRSWHVGVMTYDEKEGVDVLRRKFESNGTECCVMLGSSRQTSFYKLKEMGVRSVQLYPNYMPEDDEAIVIDNATIMSLLVDHLVGLGHERIALLHGQYFDNTYMLDQEERMEGFYREMARHDLQMTSHQVCYGGFDTESGYEAAMKLLDTVPGLRPTAIIANDYNAAGVYQAAQRLGLRIPDDLSVTGIDNLTQCMSLAPLLTTIDIEWEMALDMAIDYLDTPGKAGCLRRIPVRLVERKSTASPPGGPSA